MKEEFKKILKACSCSVEFLCSFVEYQRLKKIKFVSSLIFR